MGCSNEVRRVNNTLTDGTITGLKDHVSTLLYGAKVNHTFVNGDLVLVLKGLDIDMSGELYRMDEE